MPRLRNQSRRKGFALFIILGTMLTLMSLVAAVSVESFKHSLGKSRELTQRKAFTELLQAYRSYVHDHYNRLRQASIVTNARIFPEKLSDLVEEGYLSSSDFHTCNSASCEFSLYYRSSPILYYRSPLAKAACNFVVNSDGSEYYSAATLIVMQGPIMRVSGINADSFYSSLRSAIESPSSIYLTPATIQSLYSSVASSQMYSDDMYAFITAADIANDLKTSAIERLGAYTQSIYSRFHRAAASHLRSIRLDPALAMKAALSSKETASSLCMSALADALEVSKSQLDDTILGANIGDCGSSSLILTGPLSLGTYLLQDLYKNSPCLRVRCVLVYPDGKTTTNLVDVSTWPAFDTYTSIDVRLERDFSAVSTLSTSNCPFRLP